MNDTGKPIAVIVDLDGTLCDIEHRRHFVDGTGKKKCWKSFYESLITDKPNSWCVDLVLSMANSGCEIIFATGRPEKYRGRTLSWISEHVYPQLEAANSRLFMRADGDFRKDSIIKDEIYKRDIEPYYDVKFCVDDRQQVVDMWRELGLVCLQCDIGNF